MKKVTGIILLFVLLGTTILFAQDKPNVNVRIGGTVQAMVSYAETNQDTNQLGFGIRRARLRAYSSFSKKMKGYMQMELTSPKLLDFQIDYLFSDNIKVRVGRFKPAGVLGGGLTSHSKIDIVERARIGQEWGNRTIGSDTRDYGISALGNFGDFNYFLSLHNGDGATNIKATQKKAGKLLNGSVAMSGLFTYKPKAIKGLNIGGYYGIGNSFFNDYNSFSGHIYWEPKPIRVKAEYIAIVDKNNSTDVTTNGYYVMGAYGITKSIELLARYENYDPNTGINNLDETFITIGARYFMFPSSWTSSKITAAYVIHNEEADIANNVFYVMFQLLF
ncbi:MAG: porin [Melioribacteraceae bacterium]